MFPESYNGRNLARVTDTAGYKIELHRDAKKSLQEVFGPTGGSIKLSYDDGDRIVHTEEGQGNTLYLHHHCG